jgi:hypothetical protein
MWWSRLARPALHGWAEAAAPLRLVEQAVAKADRDPKARACYGLMVRWARPAGARTLGPHPRPTRQIRHTGPALHVPRRSP